MALTLFLSVSLFSESHGFSLRTDSGSVIRRIYGVLL
ncbi:MAG: hypothetical protein KatS3mg032_1498 [Cyclobacteriaceae bacterium]|nr:MAG: hypothetical protein KatS3mg032_1498 [Cyclobacteriaceae bacterium]